MSEINGGALVVEALLAAGIDTLFGINGAHVDAVYQASRHSRLCIIDVRHEMNAGHAAEGFARSSGRVGAALVTAGGGFTNVLTSIANARLDRTPVVYLTGSGPLDSDQTNDLQAGIDQVAMAAPVTKWAHRITRTEQIPRLLAQAVRIATDAPRGPVLVDIPWDVLRAVVDHDAIPAQGVERRGAAGMLGETAEEVLRLVSGAERPVAVVGAEAARSGRTAALHALADRCDLPLFSDYEGLGEIVGSDRACGLVQRLAGLPDDQRPDVVLMLGTRFGLNTAGGSGLLIPHAATVVQIDPDARELGRLQPVALGIAAEVGASIEVLLNHARSGGRPSDHAEWRAVLGEHRKRRLASTAEAAVPGDRIHPFHAVQAVADAVPEGAVVVADGALTYHWLSETIDTAPLDKFLCHGFFGSMGVGMGVALGAQAARPGDAVVLVTGDGSVGYSLGEFDSMVRAGLPVVVVVMNNRAWGATWHGQEIVHGPEAVTNNSLDNGSYAGVAEALGARGRTITDVADLRPAIVEALAGGRPTCLDVQIDLAPIAPEEKVLMGQSPF